ncbi:conserved hypothetical protein [Parasphingorhabdus marina DSM 22363]|uniref:2OG-Fe(II) oxygenase n=2 Tax=Parasphingorhabdus marina TaxID=394732 RepID=A0A1N6CM15_9SPHN|nr:conserved hypothetical protein [Parasphingorhabdus marina DSM 22363]
MGNPQLKETTRSALRAAEEGDPERGVKLERALETDPYNGALIIQHAVARVDSGDRDPFAHLTDIIRRAPDWVDGHAALARLRWETGDRENFLFDLEQALGQQPKNPALWNLYIDLLAAVERFEEAADGARAAINAGFADPVLQLIEAMHAGSAGDHRRAMQLFAELPDQLTGRAVNEARQHMRMNQLDRASVLLDQAREENPEDLTAWALTELIWRSRKDPRHDWLFRNGGLISFAPVGLDDTELEDLTALLEKLHASQYQPVGQSVRNGTQTRGNLQRNRNPLLVHLFNRLQSAVDTWFATLPDPDPAHPLLKHRQSAIRITGGWSIRATAGGYHTSHLHPGGKISSACYISIPELNDKERAGHLQLGHPPKDIPMALEPVHMIKPRAGHLALFPSFLYHGTVPFSCSGQRMTVAFDAA